MRKPFALFPLSRSRQAFTLVELLAVVAIIGILMIVALPAYNNYSTKSKFTEVVLATAPTKTAIATCAGTGDCVSGGAISLGGGPQGDASFAFPATGAVSSPTPGEVWAATLVTFEGFGNSGAASFASEFAAQQAATPGSWIITTDPAVVPAGEFCFGTVSRPCTWSPVSQASMLAVLNKQSDPFFSTVGGGGAPLDLPCVGPASTGCSPPTKYAASVSYDPTGDITATAQTSSGLNGETFTLIPQYSSGRVDWSESGTCKTRAGGALC